MVQRAAVIDDEDRTPVLLERQVARCIPAWFTEDVLHALMRHRAEMRCKPGARLGDTTIGSVFDTLLREPLGL